MSKALRSNMTAFYNLVIAASGTSAALVNLHPLSRGTVNINPARPAAEPTVDYRALTNPVDTLVMTDILKFTRRFYMDNKRTTAWGPVQSSPGAGVQTDAQFASYLADTLSPTEYHPVGTAAMMPRELGGVVDQWLKVYGVEGLRVVDGSMMPMLPGGNTCQTVYAVAEKVSGAIGNGFDMMKNLLTWKFTGCGYNQGSREGCWFLSTDGCQHQKPRTLAYS